MSDVTHERDHGIVVRIEGYIQRCICNAESIEQRAPINVPPMFAWEAVEKSSTFNEMPSVIDGDELIKPAAGHVHLIVKANGANMFPKAVANILNERSTESPSRNDKLSQ